MVMQIKLIVVVVNLSLFSIPPLFAKSGKSIVCVFSPPLVTSKGGSFEPLEPPLLRA